MNYFSTALIAVALFNVVTIVVLAYYPPPHRHVITIIGKEQEYLNATVWSDKDGNITITGNFVSSGPPIPSERRDVPMTVPPGWEAR